MGQGQQEPCEQEGNWAYVGGWSGNGERSRSPVHVGPERLSEWDLPPSIPQLMATRNKPPGQDEFSDPKGFQGGVGQVLDKGWDQEVGLISCQDSQPSQGSTL